MKISLILLFISASLAAQQLNFRNSEVDSIKIISANSYYHFDTCGTTTGTSDAYTIVFNNKQNNYQLRLYKRINFKYTFKPDTAFKTEKVLAKARFINTPLIFNLLHPLELGTVVPDLSTLNISKDEFIKLSSEKNYIKIARRFDSYNFLTQPEKDTILKGCRSLDSLNVFLKTAFDTTGFSMITDVSDEVEVFVFTKKGNFKFEGKCPDLFKQPWHEYSNQIKGLSKPVLNLSINKALVELLPKNFIGKNSLDTKSLIETYITWYLIRHHINKYE